MQPQCGKHKTFFLFFDEKSSFGEMEVGRYGIGEWVYEGGCDIFIYTNSNDDE